MFKYDLNSNKMTFFFIVNWYLISSLNGFNIKSRTKKIADGNRAWKSEMKIPDKLREKVEFLFEKPKKI